MRGCSRPSVEASRTHLETETERREGGGVGGSAAPHSLSVALRKPEFAADVAPLLFPPAISGSGRKTRPASDVHRRTLLGHRRTFRYAELTAVLTATGNHTPINQHPRRRASGILAAARRQR